MLSIRRDAQIHREEADGYVLRFHFSFKGYQDPAYDGFGALRLFNDDRKRGVLGNRMHPHADVEVVTYVVEGTFRHQDGLGNSFVLPAGSVECLSAGTGVEHAEHNAAEADPLRMILLYVVPETKGLPPSVTRRVVADADRRDRWLHIAGPPAGPPAGPHGGPRGGGDACAVIHQQADVYAAALTPRTAVRHSLAPGRGAYLYVIRGDARVDDREMATGDAAMITDQASFTTEARAPCEMLLVEVPLLTVSAEADAAMKGDVRVTAGRPS